MRYISSQWMSEANDEMWSDDLANCARWRSTRSASRAIEKDSFYTMCDELGFLVWQVFPLLLRERLRRPHRTRAR